MSLLMEALRKAEEAKRKAAKKQGSDPDAPDQDEVGTAAVDQPPLQPPASEDARPETSLSLLDNAELDQKPDSSGTPFDPESQDTDQDNRRPDLHDYVNEMPRLSLDKNRQRRSALELDEEEQSPPPDYRDNMPQDTTDLEAESLANETETGGVQDTGNYSLESRAATRQRQLREQQDQQAASAVFRAKQAAHQKQKKRQQIRLLVVLLLLIPVGALGFWLYDSLSSSSVVPSTVFSNEQGERFLGGSAVEPSVASEDIANVDTGLDVSAANAETSSTPGPEDEVANSPDSVAPAVADTRPEPGEQAMPEARPSVADEDSGRPDTAPGNRSLDMTASAVAAQADTRTGPRTTAETSTSTLRLTRTDQTSAVPPALDRAYALFLAGNNSAARAEYEALLQEQPGNRDAMLGLASVHRREGQVSLAQNIYARLLQLNPRDPIARTGLIEAAQSADPLRRESDLKALLEEFPSLAPASFALGNLYASQQRWSQAQNAYFDALMNARQSGGIVSPDYAFNLAVSLEQLKQPEPALDYYREALSLAGQAAPSFSVSELNQRIEQLQQALR